MKKVYVVPQLTVYHSQLCNIIATSDPKVGVNRGESVDADKVETKGTGSWNLWGDDDDE